MTTPHTTPAEHLTCTRLNLLDARLAARNAARDLTGSRAIRAAELVELISDAIAHLERLRTVVEGDMRAEQATR